MELKENELSEQHSEVGTRFFLQKKQTLHFHDFFNSSDCFVEKRRDIFHDFFQQFGTGIFIPSKSG
jgi:hypothetical protein